MPSENIKADEYSQPINEAILHNSSCVNFPLSNFCFNADSDVFNRLANSALFIPAVSQARSTF